LAGGIAHDFNNLLTAIIGFSEVLALELAGPGGKMVDVRRQADAADAVAQIRSAADRAAALTRQLLAFSRRQTLQPRVVDLNAIVSGVERLLQRLLGEDVALVTTLQPDLGRVEVDPGQIEQVIVNLAVNARDAMPRGGRLQIETANVLLDESVALRDGLAPGPQVMLAISDSGHGMDRETLSHIFEPFFTTKGPGQGTGLGLATVYGIVSQTGGTIAAESELGHGTSFRIYLPRMDAGEAAAGQAQEAARQAPTGHETILVVEDEPVVRMLAVRFLRSQGYETLEAGDYEQALAAVDQHDGPLHLLLSDVVLPGRSGPEISAALERRRPGLKVLFMSGYAASAMTQQGRLDPGRAFIEKPFTPDGLARKVREVLDARDGSPA
jgi:CheY-like chemotaxis protein